VTGAEIAIVAAVSGGIATALLPATWRGLGRVRDWWVKRGDASLTGLTARVEILEEHYKSLEAAMTRVLQFIEGSEDPFTKEVTGGLLAFMARMKSFLEKQDPERKEI
jgi:hypothetical protein